MTTTLNFKKDAAGEKQAPDIISLPIDQRSDEYLINAIVGEAAEALELLYQRYYHMLYVLVYPMVADHHVAEDLIQETFFAVWRRATTYSSQAGTVRTWLASIIRHRAIDYIRHRHLLSVLNAGYWEVVEEDESLALPDVWNEAWQAIQNIWVHEALMQLPSEQRTVIVLAYFQGWTHEQIAQKYQLPLGTVKGRLRLGLVRLKLLLYECV